MIIIAPNNKLGILGLFDFVDGGAILIHLNYNGELLSSNTSGTQLPYYRTKNILKWFQGLDRSLFNGSFISYHQKKNISIK